MNILILEDEQAAAIRLQQLLKEVAPTATIVGIAESIQDAADWFAQHDQPDLILSDIQLADGLSLDILRQTGITAPVIFTTAYDAYTLSAFKLNSVDYLLKPVDKDELKAAFDKYHTLYRKDDLVHQKMLDLFKHMAGNRPPYKSRFLVRQGERLITIPVSDVAFLKADDKVVFLYTTKGQKHIIDEPLDELETILDPALFFRINRTYIAPLDSIEKISNHFNGRLKITLHLAADDDVFVSRARVADFKKWLGK